MKRIPTKLQKGVTVSYATRPPDLLAGRLCLDFVNTVTYRGAGAHERGDRLVSYSELILWALHAEAITHRQAKALLKQARKNSYDAAVVLQDAIVLRETIARLATAPSEVDKSELQYFNQQLATLPPVMLVQSGDGEFSIDHIVDHSDLKAVVWPILRDAADLLASDCVAFVRTCADRDCSWVFLDLSQSRKRKWCSMKSCGNREKASRHYHRTKG